VTSPVRADRILLATPLEGTQETAHVSFAYHTAVRHLERQGVNILPHSITFSTDVVRARSRCVDHALTEDFWDWILWWDEDVALTEQQYLARMIQRAIEDKHDVICGPYPRKRLPTVFPYRPFFADVSARAMPIIRDCIEVEGAPAGFMLTSRACLERMVDHYRPTLWCTDLVDNAPREIVEIFMLQYSQETEILWDGQPMRYRERLSEDYSFCQLWRAMGGKVQLYVSGEAPLSHVGKYAFPGKMSDLGRVR
jgi:hypothetical protein